MVKIIFAVLVILAAGMISMVLIVRRHNDSDNTGIGKKNIIVNHGINVVTGQIGVNQNKYFKGVSSETADTIYVDQMLEQAAPVPQNLYTQIIFCNLETGNTVTKNLLQHIDLGRGMWREAEFLHISENRMVSNRHCRILRENGEIYLEDLKSGNHTYLNNKQVLQRTQIKSGDIVALGPEQFRVTFY